METQEVCEACGFEQAVRQCPKCGALYCAACTDFIRNEMYCCPMCCFAGPDAPPHSTARVPEAAVEAKEAKRTAKTQALLGENKELWVKHEHV